MAKKTYVVNADGFIAGAHRTKNSHIDLTEREAKYFLLSGLIGEKKAKPAAPKEEPSPTALDKKTR